MKWTQYAYWGAISLGLSMGITQPLLAEVLEGKVVRVADGDTCTVQPNQGKAERVRFLAIDAPESKQAFGAQSKKNLEQLILNKTVKVEFNRRDQYGRITGKILLENEDINLAQVKAGFAWHYKTFARQQTPEDAKAYAAAEETARQKKWGLWAGARPQAPWAFRRENGTR